MKLSEAAKVLGLEGALLTEWMDRFTPVGSNRFAAYGDDAKAVSEELQEAIGSRLGAFSGPDYDGVGVDLSDAE